MSLPPNWRFREIIKNNKPQLILEYCSDKNWFRQYTFSVLREFKIGDEIQNIKTKVRGIITEISDHKIVIKKSRFEITISGDECDEWEKKKLNSNSKNK
jgi:hypothetical protein